MEADSINLVDKTKKMYVRIKLSENRKYWERWVSSDKKTWELSGRLKTLTEVLESQQELIDNNYKNLFDVITRK
jgi:tRNA G10  N-methylase Trm11